MPFDIKARTKPISLHANFKKPSFIKIKYIPELASGIAQNIEDL